MDISIAGTGYVGLVTEACLAEVGHRVIGIEKDVRKIERLRVDLVRREVGADPRISKKFLYAASGSGGSFHPKKVAA